MSNDRTILMARQVGKPLTMFVMAIFSVAVISAEDFNLLNYGYLWNDDAEKSQMVINPASSKKEADDWRPIRKLTETETTKLIQIMTKRFGQPARCRNGYASFVYVWRFEGDDWLSVGVCTKANNGGDAVAICHWEWRAPELSVYDEEEVKARRYPIVQIENEGLPPAAFFEFFNPYASIKDGEAENNFITEFNATKYLEESGYTRCTAEWDAGERRYDIYTAHPDKWRYEYDVCMGGPNGGHTNEYHVGAVQFYKLASNLFMCYSMFCQDGTLGPDRVRYLFEVYDRDIWSVDSNKPIKSKQVRYLGAVSIDEVPKFREEWIRGQGKVKSKGEFKRHADVLSVTGQGDEDRRRYIELVRNVALVQKPEGSPEIWYDAIPDSDLHPFDSTARTYKKHYKVVYAERQYLSFYCEDFFWDGSVYMPWPKYTVGSIDRKTGKVVTLDDVDAFADRSLLTKRLKDAVRTKTKDELIASRAFPNNSFYLAKDGWHFVYNAGDIDSLSTGPIEVVIERE